MHISRIKLTNWRNFRETEVQLGSRMFIVGANASGKSNFLDTFRFMRDVVKPGGGLQQAIIDRGGLKKIRCLNARDPSHVGLEFEFTDGSSSKSLFTYKLEIAQEPRGNRNPIVKHESATANGKTLFTRPNVEDTKDPQRLTETYLEQVNTNKDIRDVVNAFKETVYLHLVPQLLKYSDTLYAANPKADDPFGRTFLDNIAKTSEGTRKKRLKKIEDAIKCAVPQFRSLQLDKDETGKPHLKAVYEHWRPQGANQWEDQFSDGTLRLIGLFWSLLDGNSLLLLEEPELSLHSAVIRQLPSIIARLAKKRQVIISTHSADMLLDSGIGGEEVIALTPTDDGTIANSSVDIAGVREMLENGFSIAEAVLPHTAPKSTSTLSQLSLDV